MSVSSDVSLLVFLCFLVFPQWWRGVSRLLVEFFHTRNRMQTPKIKTGTFTELIHPAQTKEMSRSQHELNSNDLLPQKHCHKVIIMQSKTNSVSRKTKNNNYTDLCINNTLTPSSEN
jgi:hypothetical protein